uniref:RING-type domain-containing protein n=1 Tax=Steinernema glaseri TaxID=37863 RepID=A0A1I7XXT4_9BILA
MCFVTKQNNDFLLNSFYLKNGAREVTRKELIVADDIKETMKKRAIRSFVCGDVVYSFYTFYTASVLSTHLLKLDLGDCTIEDITDKVENMSTVRILKEGATGGEGVLYLWGISKDLKLTLWKMEESDEPSSVISKEEFPCEVCHNLFRVPKVFPCGHTICGRCERELEVDVKEKKKTLVCPNCKKSVVLEANEALPTNEQDSFLCFTCGESHKKNNCVHCSTCTEAQKKANEALPTNEQDSFLCFTCGQSHKKNNCVHCSTCTEAQKKTVLICGMCAFKKHKDHVSEEVTFPSLLDKTKVFATEDTAKIEADIDSLEQRLLEEIRKSAKIEALKTTLEDMVTMKKKILEDRNVTTADLKTEIGKYKDLAVKAELEQKAVEEWIATIFAVIRG